MEYQLSNSAIEIPKDKALQDLLRKLSNKKPEEKARRLFIINELEILTAYNNDFVMIGEDIIYSTVLVGKWKKHQDENLYLRAFDNGIGFTYKEDNNSYSYLWRGVKYQNIDKFKMIIIRGINHDKMTSLMNITDDFIKTLEDYKK